jgi:hypothetical protein
MSGPVGHAVADGLMDRRVELAIQSWGSGRFCVEGRAMPIHDWTRVDAGIFHDFHLSWIFEIRTVLNSRLLPTGYYALAEQQMGDFQPDVLTLKQNLTDPTSVPEAVFQGNGHEPAATEAEGGLLLAEPRVSYRAESDRTNLRRKQNVVAVRHVSGDRLVAVIEIVSRGNKSSQQAIDAFLRKAAALLDRGIHLLLVDLQPPTPRDPQGIHSALWEYIEGETAALPAWGENQKPLTLAGYDADPGLRAYVEPVAVGDTMIDMPLFLVPGLFVPIPLEATYQAAYATVPRRWRAVLDAAQPG